MESNGNYNILLGAKLDSYNRGVNALAIGGINFIRNNFNNNKTVLINFDWNNNETGSKSILINGEEEIIEWYKFSKKEFIFSTFEALLHYIFKRKPKSELSKIVFESTSCFNLNEGDSFSDIYGKRRFFTHFLTSFVILLWKKQLAFLPQTIGPFNTKYGKVFSALLLKKVKKIFVRDTAALSFLKKNKIKVEIRVDVAVKMETKQVELPNFINNKKQVVGININGLMYFDTYGISNYNSNYKKLLKEIVDLFINNNYNVVLIPHTYSVISDFSENDYKAIKDFIRNYGDSINSIHYLQNEYDAQEIKYIISQLDLFIGSRMHSCIAALSTSIPTIGIAYSYKFKGTFAHFNQENCVFDIQKIDNELIKESITDWIHKKELIKRELTTINSQLN